MLRSLYRGLSLAFFVLLVTGCVVDPPQKDPNYENTLFDVRVNSLSQTSPTATQLQAEIDVLYEPPGGTGANVEVRFLYYIDDQQGGNPTAVATPPADPVDHEPILYRKAPYTATHQPDVDQLGTHLSDDHLPFRFRDFDRVTVLVTASLPGQAVSGEREFFFLNGVFYDRYKESDRALSIVVAPEVTSCLGGQSMQVRLNAARRFPTEVQVSSIGNRQPQGDQFIDTSCIQLNEAASSISLTDLLGNTVPSESITFPRGESSDPTDPNSTYLTPAPIPLDITGPLKHGNTERLPQFGRITNGQCEAFGGPDPTSERSPNVIIGGRDCCACLQDVSNACSVNDRLDVSECYGSDTVTFTAVASGIRAPNGVHIERTTVRPMQGTMNCTNSGSFNQACAISWQEP